MAGARLQSSRSGPDRDGHARSTSQRSQQQVSFLGLILVFLQIFRIAICSSAEASAAEGWACLATAPDRALRLRPKDMMLLRQRSGHRRRMGRPGCADPLTFRLPPMSMAATARRRPAPRQTAAVERLTAAPRPNTAVIAEPSGRGSAGMSERMRSLARTVNRTSARRAVTETSSAASR
jgi:hypothetical protein